VLLIGSRLNASVYEVLGVGSSRNNERFRCFDQLPEAYELTNKSFQLIKQAN
jgi:hypothetical protein